MSNAMISAPNRLNPGNCLSHEATSEAAKVTMPTKTISLVAMRAHHVLQKSITCLKCSGRFGHRYGTESDDFSAAGLPGLALQWALIPLAAYWTESLIAKRNH